MNLLSGVPPTESRTTCLAAGGTFLLEFATLSRLTGNPVWEKHARRAVASLWKRRSAANLLGSHLDTESGAWTDVFAGVGGGHDSFYEYLLKVSGVRAVGVGRPHRWRQPTSTPLAGRGAFGRRVAVAVLVAGVRRAAGARVRRAIPQGGAHAPGRGRGAQTVQAVCPAGVLAKRAGARMAWGWGWGGVDGVCGS